MRSIWIGAGWNWPTKTKYHAFKCVMIEFSLPRFQIQGYNHITMCNSWFFYVVIRQVLSIATHLESSAAFSLRSKQAFCSSKTRRANHWTDSPDYDPELTLASQAIHRPISSLKWVSSRGLCRHWSAVKCVLISAL